MDVLLALCCVWALSLMHEDQNDDARTLLESVKHALNQVNLKPNKVLENVCIEEKTITHLFIIDREAREIMYLVASVCLSICLSPLSRMNRAVKSNKSHYQSKVFVCVSIFSGRMRIIAQMRSISF